MHGNNFVFHFPSRVWFIIILQSCIFQLCDLVRHLQVLHIPDTVILWFIIFWFCQFSACKWSASVQHAISHFTYWRITGTQRTNRHPNKQTDRQTDRQSQTLLKTISPRCTGGINKMMQEGNYQISNARTSHHWKITSHWALSTLKMLSPKADTHFIIPWREEGWVDLDRAEVLDPPVYSQR